MSLGFYAFPARAADPPRNYVALTLDDGPDENAGRVMNILRNNNARGVFFVIGANVTARPGQVRRMRDEGHVIGNHTYDHVDLTTLGAPEIGEQFALTNAALARLNVVPDLFRPPFNRANESVWDAGWDQGMAMVRADCDPADWSYTSARPIRQNVQNCDLQNGSIIQLHSWNAATSQALPGMIRDIRARGFCLGIVKPSTVWNPLHAGWIEVAPSPETDGC
ncbi:polysaccharide deacetylase family protein [Cryptosporangium minutisporangium]